MKTFEQFESSFSKAKCKLCNNEAMAYNAGFCYQHTPSQPNSEEGKMMFGHTSGNEVQFNHSPKPEEKCTCKIRHDFNSLISNLASINECPIHGVKLKTNLHTSDEWWELREKHVREIVEFIQNCPIKGTNCNICFNLINDYLSTAIKTREEEIARELKEICNKCKTERGLARVIGNFINKLIK